MGEETSTVRDWILAGFVLAVAILGVGAFVHQGLTCGWMETDTACDQPDTVALMPLPPAFAIPMIIVFLVVTATVEPEDEREENG